MHGSATVGWQLAVLCAVTGTACLLRARAARTVRRRAAAGEAAMGFGMAAMALPGGAAATVPPAVFVVLFGAVGAWELTLLRGRPYGRRTAAHCVHHLVGCLAMVYMALAMAGPGSGHASGPGHVHSHVGAVAAGLTLLTVVLLAYFGAYMLRTGLRLLPVTVAAGPGAGTGTAVPVPGGCAVGDAAVLATACRLAMGTGMFAMLLTV